ncbi:MAG: hypothetical protein LUH49_07430, partial [Cloacibacillus porcorum]|uniref:hypothetical protein n=1 Tax=Cloacibacillus porcorum TaxID=1197717 RepID=UPI0023F13EF4
YYNPGALFGCPIFGMLFMGGRLLGQSQKQNRKLSFFCSEYNLASVPFIMEGSYFRDYVNQWVVFI